MEVDVSEKDPVLPALFRKSVCRVGSTDVFLDWQAQVLDLIAQDSMPNKYPDSGQRCIVRFACP